MEKKLFGILSDGRQVHSYTLENARGESVTILDLGGIIRSLNVRNARGGYVDVALGYDSPGEYLDKGGYLGSIVGRYANRIGGSRFSLNGVTYNLNSNDGKNHLHGGFVGFDKKIWDVRYEDGKLALSLLSPHMEENYPGGLNVEVTYSFTDEGELVIEYRAQSDRDTIVNLTNHCYFNLNGGGDVLSHELRICAEYMLPADAELIPTGEIRSVKGTPFDFTDFKPIGKDIESDDEQLKFAGGFDHNFCLDKSCKRACELFSGESGILMEVFTDKPGLQFYSGNFLSGVSGKGGAVYNKRAGLCLETQHYPDSVNKPHFPSPILRAGETYRYRTTYKFSTK